MHDLTFAHLFEDFLPFEFNRELAPWIVLEYLDRFFEEFQGSIHKEAFISPAAELIDPDFIVIQKNARIESGVQIQGPCFIGEKVHVRHGASLRGGVMLLEGSVVGHCSEIKRSILMPQAKAPHFNYIGDSIVGSKVNLGASVILCNQRLDKQNVSIRSEDAKITTGLKKFGACIGDNASLGAGTICNPGTIFEKGTACIPRSLITGFYEGAVWSET